MIIETLKGNLSEIDTTGFDIDYIDIQWYDTRKKIARFKTQKGRDIPMRLKNVPKFGLSQGDILLQEDKYIVAINILPTEVLCIYAKSLAEVAKICYEIGNRHAALYFGENEFEFKTSFDHPMKALFDKLGISNAILSSKLDSKDRISVSMVHSEPNFKIKESPNLSIKISGGKCENE